MTDQQQAWRPWTIWGLAVLFFFIGYVPRVITGVITPYLMQDFAVMAGAMGTLTSFYFYPYVLMQIPVGLLVDRFGPRLLLTIMIALSALSCLLFSRALDIHVAQLSRLLLGFSAAFAFVGALKLAAEWFPPARIGLLTGLTQSLGMLGAVLGEHPTALMVESLGWRGTLLVVATILFILSVLVFIFIRNKPKNAVHYHVGHHFKEGGGFAQEFKRVLSNPQSWINGLCAGLLFAPTGAFAEQWGNYYLRIVYGNESPALAIGMIFLGWGVAGPVMGWLSNRVGKRKPFIYASSMLSLILFCLILYGNLSMTVLMVIMFLFGIANTGVVVNYALSTEINPHRVAGTSLAIANMMSILIGAAFQPLIGYLMDIFALGHVVLEGGLPYNSADLQKSMMILPISLVFAFICTFFIRETHCKPLEVQLASNRGSANDEERLVSC